MNSPGKKISLNIFGVLTLILLIMALAFSIMTAAVVAAVVISVLAVAGLVIFWKIRRALTRLDKSLTSAFTMDIRLEPRDRRHSRNRPAVEALAGELAGLGFIPAGFYKIADQDIYVEGMAHPGLRMYALITESGDYQPPYTEISTSYADGGSFCVTSCPFEAIFPRPVNMINLNFEGASPTALFHLLRQRRPAGLMLETPPDKFKETVEEEIQILRETLMDQADDNSA